MQLTWQRNRRRLKHPFETARGRRDHQETIIVTLDHAGIRGLGEACAMAIYGHTLETIEQTLAAIADRITARDPFHIEHILDALLVEFDTQRAAVAAVDMALHDWIGKRLNIPTLQWLGLDAARAPLTDITIGIDDPATIAQKVREAIEFPAFKVKVGVSNELDIIRTIRREAPQTPLRLDANCGWTAEDAERRLRAIVDITTPDGVEFLEQPVPAADFATLRQLRELGIVPVIADESCVRPADVLKLAGVVDGVNIKLNKCGGIREGRKLIDMARALGLRIMIGCTSESAIGVAAAAQLAPLADWIDLDTHLLAADQPYIGIGGERGRLSVAAGPGLGVCEA